MTQSVGTKSLYKKEDIIVALVKARVEKCASTTTLINFLTVDMGFGVTMAYEYLKWMRERMAEVYGDRDPNQLKAEAVLQYEEAIEVARQEKNWKMWSELNRELNKIKQIAIEKHEINIIHDQPLFPDTINIQHIDITPQNKQLDVSENDSSESDFEDDEEV